MQHKARLQRVERRMTGTALRDPVGYYFKTGELPANPHAARRCLQLKQDLTDFLHDIRALRQSPSQVSNISN